MKKTALNFTYGKQSSMEFEIIKINFDSGIFHEETILSEREINYEMRRETNIADIYSVEYKTPLTFEMELLLGEEFNRDYLKKVIRWLKRDTFLPLVFDTMPDLIFYAIIISDFKIYHNMNNKGYLKVTVTCNAPYGFTMVQSSPVYTNVGTSKISIIANSDFDTSLFKALIKKNGNGDLLIKNVSNETEYSLVDLEDGMQIVVDSFNHLISASDKDNKEIIINDKKNSRSWITLWAEYNDIEIIGDAEIQFLWQGNKVV